MPDVFGRSTEFGGAISADGTRVTFDDFRIGFLAQTLQLTYAQQITRIFELSSNRQYYVIGRPQGNIAMSRVIGPTGLTTTFINKFGNACNADRNTINLSAQSGCASTATGALQGLLSTGGVNYTASNVVLTQLGVNIAAQDMLINEAYQMMFVGLVSGNPPGANAQIQGLAA